MFPRAQRLNSVAVAHIQKKGIRSFTPFFRMMFLPASEFRISCVIPKKVISRRIDRNREKRRILHTLKNIFHIKTIFWYVIYLQKDTSTLSLDELRIELLNLIYKQCTEKSFNKNIYISLVLDKQSEALLRNNIAQKHKNSFYHHMTVIYNLDKKDFKTYKNYIGTQSSIKTKGVCFDEKGQAALVKAKLCEAEFPHITLSCIDGIGPFYSNELLKNNTNYTSIALSLSGTIKLTFIKLDSVVLEKI